MARAVRVEYEGAWYHVMARGNRREKIFVDDKDREIFLKTLGEVCGMTGWEVHAWVLMTNHYHFVIRTPEANLVEGMKWLQNTFTRRFNGRHKQWGRLFGDRYKSVLVEGAEEVSCYLETVLDYVHLNPVRAKLITVGKGASVRDYPWSSVARGYALLPGKRPKWQYCEEGLAAFGWKDTTSGRRKMIEHLDARAEKEEEKRCGVPELPPERDRRLSELRNGWYWGSQAFREKALTLVGRGLGKTQARAYRSAGGAREYGERAAEKILTDALAKLKAMEESIKEWPRGDERKLMLAILLRKKTTVSGKWIAEKLHMKSAANVSQRIRTADLPNLLASLPKDLKAVFSEI